MRTVIWSDRARKDALEQFEYLGSQSPEGLRIVRSRLFDAVERLSEFPVGRPSRALGVFEKLVPKTSLIIAYSLSDESKIEIMRVLHSKQNWQEMI